MLPNPAIVLRRETARSGPEPCRFPAKHCHVPGKRGNPGSCRARIRPGECRSPRYVRISPLRSCPAADPRLRRRKTKGRKGPSFDLTRPALRHPSLPQPHLCHILLSFTGVKPLVPARNTVGFWQNTVMFREKEVIRAHAGPGFDRGNAGPMPGSGILYLACTPGSVQHEDRDLPARTHGAGRVP